MENTLENKEKFFAQYWDQDIIKVNMPLWGNKTRIVDSITLESDSLNFFFLELKPLSQISAEDAIQVARIIGYSSSDIETINYLNNQVKTITSEKGIFYFLDMYKIDALTCYKVFQFLRSKGYYIGDGTEIEYGWVKLKEVK